MAIKKVIEPLVDPYFSESSYGFRPGRNQRQAVQAAQEIVSSGKEFIVDIDLSKFFEWLSLRYDPIDLTSSEQFTTCEL